MVQSVSNWPRLDQPESANPAASKKSENQKLKISITFPFQNATLEPSPCTPSTRKIFLHENFETFDTDTNRSVQTYTCTCQILFFLPRRPISYQISFQFYCVRKSKYRWFKLLSFEKIFGNRRSSLEIPTHWMI